MQDRLGGRWAISWQAYLALAPSSVLSTVLVQGVAGNLASRSWFLISITSYLFFGFELWLADRTILRSRREKPAPVFKVVLVGILIGFVKGYSTIWFAAEIGEIDWNVQVAIFNGISTSLTLAAGLPALALLSDSIATIVKTSRELDEQQIAIQSQKLNNQHALMDLQKQLVDRLENQFGLTEPFNDSRDVKNTLRDVAEKARPLSHQLWSESETLPTKFDRKIVFKAVFRESKINWLFVFSIYALTTAIPIAQNAGAEGVFPRLSVAVISSGLAIWGTSVWFNRLVTRSWIHLVSVISISVIFPIEMQELLFEPTELPILLNSFGILFIWSTCLFLLDRVVNNSQSESHQLLDTLNDLLDTERQKSSALQNLQAKVNRDAAAYLHGPFQSQLQAIIGAIDHAEKKLDVDQIHVLVHQAIELINNPLFGMNKTPHESLDQALLDVQMNWDGMVSLTFSHEHPPTSSPHSEDEFFTFSAIVDEAIRNAFRHAGADSLEIRIVCDAGKVTFTATNPAEVTTKNPRGLGSALFDLKFGADWSLTFTDGEAQLRGILPRLDRSFI